MSSNPFPVANSITPYWRTEPDSLDSHRSTEALPATSDIVIIGAGYAGASTAYHLLDQADPSSRPSIVILEARQVCSGATGRNGGHLKPDVYNFVGTVAQRYGVEAAAELAAFECAHIPAIQAVVEREKISCDLVVSQAHDVQLDETHTLKLQAGYDALIAKGSEPTKTAAYTTGKEAERVSGVKDAVGCFSYRAGRLWPYKLIVGLLKKAIAKGANLQTNTPVLSVSESQDSEGRWTVQTERGCIQAKHIVFSSNAYTSAIAPEYEGKIVPVRGICSRVVTPDPPHPLTPSLHSSYTVRIKEGIYEYLVPRPDGSIIIGGARSVYVQDLKNWYNVTDDASLIEPAKHHFNGYMQKYFHGWGKTGAYTDRVWTGIMGYTTDSLPHVGHVPGKPGQLIVAGFNGHGMPQIFLSAKGIAQMILTGAEFEDTGVPRIFKTTQVRLDDKGNTILALSGVDTSSYST
ncbi:NAD(P)/FAD-dependent oxidoreductase [Aspergillus undulatus]|uniref:NAD(P)/FAD-dependent oxidoreductase n=1 Tax=Aspergillus undulatus TaxID=1810928 RepID=UPI003CCDDC44